MSLLCHNRSHLARLFTTGYLLAGNVWPRLPTMASKLAPCSEYLGSDVSLRADLREKTNRIVRELSSELFSRQSVHLTDCHSTSLFAWTNICVFRAICVLQNSVCSISFSSALKSSDRGRPLGLGSEVLAASLRHL